MFFPFMCDVSGKKIAVIGGGRVALRKCELFLDFGADVTVIAPALCGELLEMRGSISHICDVYREEYIRDAFAVIAACDDAAVNKAVSAWCSENNVLVNVVDEPEDCSFIVPSVLRRGDLTISVSTGGKSPALAAKIRRELSEAYGGDYEKRLKLLGELKSKLKLSEPDREKRAELLIAAAGLEEDALNALIKGIAD